MYHNSPWNPRVMVAGQYLILSTIPSSKFFSCPITPYLPHFSNTFHKSTATPRGKGIIPRSRWRRSALVFAAAALLTFIIHLSFVIWATTHSNDDPSGVVRPGIGIIASGDTVLLAGSNYCMQCLIAPTRKEIDAAHAENDWLDVGIPSIRNFWRIAWKRKIVWSLLALSSFFNSVVFTSTSTNLYDVYSITPGFLPSHIYPEIYTDTTQFVYLDTRKCLDEYGTAFQSSRGDLVVVPVSDLTMTHNKLSKIKSNATWTAATLLFSSVLCWTVTALNVIKGLLMLFVAYGNTERPVLTIGDAIAMALSTKISLDATTFVSIPHDVFLYQHVTNDIRWFLAILVFTSLLIIGLRANGYQPTLPIRNPYYQRISYQYPTTITPSSQSNSSLAYGRLRWD
ncbi:hypothetical protein CCUS01_05571 [Colletotrichum cuscutae]|uniref:DUF6536 domain-containing protein n=1 Tax=Colletotrichum cuscutae TaxID=1209917 RepID=A0AAI9Y552_9PEZI|nr:hypothetical protein CCUS01_05571 [Colletotrichum cuscutae]